MLRDLSKGSYVLTFGACCSLGGGILIYHTKMHCIGGCGQGVKAQLGNFPCLPCGGCSALLEDSWDLATTCSKASKLAYKFR